MTAAFLLSINMFVAALFATAFAVVAATNPSIRGARWLAAAYGIGVVDVALEFCLPWLVHPNIAVVGIYITYLAALSFGVLGVASHYKVRSPRRLLSLIWAMALGALPIILTLPYGSTPRLLLYQLPYAALQVLMIWVVFRSGRRKALDRLLMVVSGLAALSCLFKPAIAWQTGTATGPQGYMASQYAAVSQTMGSVTLIALALILLLVIMRDTMLEMMVRSETDPLSGALNRRGFERQAARLIELAQRKRTAVSFITLDLDRFKSINDRFGHAAGDEVIVDLGQLLADAVDDKDIVARVGGEEFAILLPGRTSDQAGVTAENIRSLISRKLRVRSDSIEPVTASLGVTQYQPGEQLSDLSRRSDLALYDAKSAGRNTVFIRKAASPKPPKPSDRNMFAWAGTYLDPEGSRVTTRNKHQLH
ncbi:GGDEF domain-containing protein [Novosphingopyxis sp. YJ-S2-01]|uniref:GGDEF domain-containing protein n=1 Tax=Novosphingopyxis sp. YJ-S2-01 TaxID=2794021 RepID=UPI0018DB8115|nr:GGDEF domain-containing protein [Novosphingopyxis sp. YJ-S2-01]MBH9537829.1 GGDEF domain-containing protein [Novosphingopyxis sp. YJ-S2-01]